MGNWECYSHLVILLEEVLLGERSRDNRGWGHGWCPGKEHLAESRVVPSDAIILADKRKGMLSIWPEN